MLDLAVRGVDLVHLEDGCHGDRFRGLVIHFVHRLQVALPSPFLISSKDPNPVRGMGISWPGDRWRPLLSTH